MSELLKSPAVPTAILQFFSNHPNFSALAGDLDEEFQQRAQRSGGAAAKRWYWGEVLRNAALLTASEIRRTPLQSIAVALGCLIAVNIATGIYLAVQYHPFRPLQWDPMELVLSPKHRDGFLWVQFVAAVLIGRMGARLLPGREWALALVFTLISLCGILTAAGFIVFEHAHMPPAMRQFTLAGLAVRIGAFWLGSLWIRQSRNGKLVAGHIS
jgi:hypothetical protein